MNLNLKVYHQLLKSVPAPPETGGIIGAKDTVGIIIYEDKPLNLNNYSYIPNTMVLNKVLAEWMEKGMYLYGFYHTHIQGGVNLSKQDKSYILKIMQSLRAVNSLYFPIVIPNDTIIAYKAKWNNGCLSINRENIYLIN